MFDWIYKWDKNSYEGEFLRVFVPFTSLKEFDAGRGWPPQPEQAAGDRADGR